ncbi:lysophospholipid acyltransferase family protein [Treponema brennaborense]|uniref:Phospholipid/glycerol acyltransferase n=1 Tax=Treponema brennaborense (strain DSM 12168 / CIP 105900 / DD5/3) TaxID=906968 RepID=F4LIM6_TREBD|nr:lysophospholipid acyltransferase family protein [Treponema brennaborense]AEE17251.1 phospholipid/glycerol acyltransferase [Treponema brennaborense DSM 12168]
MTNFITIGCFLVALGGPAILNIFAYPISRKLSVKISDYIVRVCAPRLFSILSTYKNFKFCGDKNLKSELPEQFLIVSNHQSLLDIPLYMRFLRDKKLRFVAKAELGRHVPLVSEMLRAHEHAMIPRTGSPSVAMKTLDSFAERVVARAQIPVIFPEGTRSRDGNLGSFYAAGFRRLLDRAPMPVAVCALDGGYKVSTLDGIMRKLHNGLYHVKILKIYPAPTSKQEQMRILEESKVLIQRQLDEWRAGTDAC